MKKIAFIGVGNMAKAIISGIRNSNISLSKIYLYDLSVSQYETLIDENTIPCASIPDAIKDADCVLLSVKPQNYPEVLNEIAAVPFCSEKLYRIYIFRRFYMNIAFLSPFAPEKPKCVSRV